MRVVEATACHRCELQDPETLVSTLSYEHLPPRVDVSCLVCRAWVLSLTMTAIVIANANANAVLSKPAVLSYCQWFHMYKCVNKTGGFYYLGVHGLETGPLLRPYDRSRCEGVRAFV